MIYTPTSQCYTAKHLIPNKMIAQDLLIIIAMEIVRSGKLTRGQFIARLPCRYEQFIVCV